MDDLLEVIVELVLDLLFEASGDKKLPKWVRYPLIGILSLLACGMVVILVAASISLMKDNVVAGAIVLAVVCLVILALVVVMVRRYRKRKKEKDIEPLEQEWQ